MLSLIRCSLVIYNSETSNYILIFSPCSLAKCASSFLTTINKFFNMMFEESRVMCRREISRTCHSNTSTYMWFYYCDTILIDIPTVIDRAISRIRISLVTEACHIGCRGTIESSFQTRVTSNFKLAFSLHRALRQTASCRREFVIFNIPFSRLNLRRKISKKLS